MNRDMPAILRAARRRAARVRSSTSPPRARSPRAGTTRALVPDEHASPWRSSSTTCASRDWLRRYLHISSPEATGPASGSVDRGAPAEPEHAVRGLEGGGRHAAHDLSQAVRVPAADGAGDERLRGPAAALQDHPALGDLREARQDDRAARRRQGGEVVHPHPRRFARRAGDPGARPDRARSTTCRPTAASRSATWCGRSASGWASRSRTRRPRSTSGPGRTRPTSSTRPRARTELGWAPRISLEEGLADVVDWVERELGRDQQAAAGLPAQGLTFVPDTRSRSARVS